MARRRRWWTWAVGWACVSLWLTTAAAAEIEPASSVEQDVSDDLLRQAFASELKGDANEWRQRLEEALTILPGEKLTNSLLGQVLVDGKWQAVDELQKKQANDPRLTEYRFRRERLNGKYRPELELARWCAEVKWNDLAKLHYARMLAYPDATENARTEACRILQLKAVDGQYVTAEELATLEEQKKTKQQAFETWRPKIVAWRKACGSKNHQFAEQALTALREVDDSQAILAIEASLYDSNEAFAAELIKLLSKFPEFEATQSLVRFALLTPSTSLAQAAVIELKPRPIHDYYPQLLVLMQAPVQSQFRLVASPDGVLQYEHVVGQQGPHRNLVFRNDRSFRPTVQVTRRLDGGQPEDGLVIDARNVERISVTPPRIGDRSFSPVTRTYEDDFLLLASFLTALAVERKVAITNQQISLSNERVFYILENTCPVRLARAPTQYWDWWRQYQEKPSPAPTQWVYYHQETQYRYYFPATQYYSCFLAGTPVWTESGKQAIEKLRPGDRVLSRNVESGELQFKLVLAKTLQAPSPVVKLVAGDDEIVATKSHPFWVSGKGWKMAKELVAGDVLHTLNGPVKVTSAALQPVPQEAHNLVVEGFNTYFVGDSALLVHDNTYWQPTTTIVPGMRAAK